MRVLDIPPKKQNPLHHLEIVVLHAIKETVLLCTLANIGGAHHCHADGTNIIENVGTEGTAAGECGNQVICIVCIVNACVVVGKLIARHDKGSCKRPRARDIRENSNIYIIFNKINFLLKNSFFHFLFTTCKIF